MAAPRPETLLPPQAMEWEAVQKMRTFVNQNDPQFFGAKKAIFRELFPQPKDSEDPSKALFKIESVSQNAECEYSTTEKEISRSVLTDFGWDKSKGRMKFGSYDMPHLYIAYNDNPRAITTHLNRLEFMKRQDAIGMADMSIQSSPEGTYKMTRGQHVRHMASLMFRDVVRSAIKTPTELIARIHEDFKRYGYTKEQTITLLSGKNDETIKHAGEATSEGISAEQANALDLALEYAKYLIMFAYIHDERTPAWGDAIMKGSGRFLGQKTVDYSEDVKLAEDIDTMIGLERASGTDTGLPHMFDSFFLDRQFFSKLVKSLSSEGDSCLGGILMKNKKKALYEAQNPELAAQLRNIGAAYKQRDPASSKKEKLGAVFDEDQTSGTIANLYDIAAQILPGGFHYIPKIRNTNVADVTKLPYGSFYERLSLLAFALSTGKSKSDLEAFCTQNGIDSDRLYIARDEFHIGANFKLEAVPELNGEILPVGVDPGGIKRLMYAFATLTYFHYQSDARSGLERLMQDIITTVHQAQFDHNIQHPEAHLGKPEETEILSMFLNTTDEGAAQSLESALPILPYIKNSFLSKITRLTAGELATRVDEIKSRDHHYLISEAQVFPVDKKPGTLTKNDNNQTSGYLEIIQKKRDTNEIHDDSLPRILEHVEDRLESEKFYHVVELSKEDVETLQIKLMKTHSPVIRELIKKAIRYWTLELHVDGNTFGDGEMRNEFLLANEIPSVPLLEQSDRDINIHDLMATQSLLNTAL